MARGVKKLSEKDWLQIKARYELGHNLRKIADEFKYDAGNITTRAKKEGWKHARLQQPIEQGTKLLAEVTTDLQQIELDVVRQEIQEKFEMAKDQLAITKSIINIDKGGLNLHGMMLKNTLNQIQSGEMSIREASQIANNMGLSIDRIAARNGMLKENNNATNIQINNESSEDKVFISIEGVKNGL